MSSALNTYESDACCNAPLIRALVTAELSDADTWTCPECGCIWKAKQFGDVKHWTPVPDVVVFPV